MCNAKNIVLLQSTSQQWLASLNHFWQRTPVGGQDYNTTTGLVITFPRRIIRLLVLSTDQKSQLQAILKRFQEGLLTIELEKQIAFTALEKAVMSAFDKGTVKQRQGELVAASAKRVQVYAEMLREMRKVLTSEQITRIRPELRYKRNHHQLNVPLPEGFSDIGLSHDQHREVGTVVCNRVPKMNVCFSCCTICWSSAVYSSRSLR